MTEIATRAACGDPDRDLRPCRCRGGTPEQVAAVRSELALMLDMHVIFRDISTKGSWCSVESERGL
jgi:hypothetical protein